MTNMAFRPSWAHRAWRALPARRRRYAMTYVTSVVAPRIARNPPERASGVAVVGETSRASGLGEAARLTLEGLERAAIPRWQVDVGGLLPAHTPDLVVSSEGPPAGGALVNHVTAPLLPILMFRLPRSVVRGRRNIGGWVWELPIVPAEW